MLVSIRLFSARVQISWLSVLECRRGWEQKQEKRNDSTAVVTDFILVMRVFQYSLAFTVMYKAICRIWLFALVLICYNDNHSHTGSHVISVIHDMHLWQKNVQISMCIRLSVYNVHKMCVCVYFLNKCLLFSRLMPPVRYLWKRHSSCVEACEYFSSSIRDSTAK